MEDKFTFCGIEMDRFTVAYGCFLIIWALVVSILTDSNSFTSWIPAFIGAPIALMGILTILYPSRRKIWMHVAILLGVLAFLGGLDFFRGVSDPDGPFKVLAAGVSKLMLFLTGGIYIFGSIRSFLWARRYEAENE